MDALAGTFLGRWYVVLFGAAFVVLGRRVLGWKRLGIYAGTAFAVAAVSENASVVWGVPYTKYTFNPALRGEELWLGDVPLAVPLSYTFVMYFAFSAARAVVAGPWRTAPPHKVGAYGLGVVFATWSTWTLDPVSQRGAHWYLGELFEYAGDGFWFGLPLGSQAGWLCVSALLCGVLAFLTRRDEPVPVRPRANPLLACAGVFLVQVLHVSIVAVAIGEHTLGAAGLLIWLPVAGVVALLWPQLKPPQPPAGNAGDVVGMTRGEADGPAALTHAGRRHR
jgi:uncharacterized membrane protein